MINNGALDNDEALKAIRNNDSADDPKNIRSLKIPSSSNFKRPPRNN